MSESIREMGAAAERGAPPVVARLRQRFQELQGFQELQVSKPGAADRGEAAQPPPPFEVRFPDGGRYAVGDGPAAFVVSLADARGQSAIASFDELAVVEAYMTGALDFEGHILSVLQARPVLADRRPLRYLWSTYLEPLLFGQVASDKRWIQSHYDIPRDFFLLWLDDEVHSYSHGFFETADEPLASAMQRKLQYAFDACGMRAGHRVLDVGGGWGSFMRFAGERGVHVTSVTISDESVRTLEELIAEHDLESCRVLKQHFLEFDPEGELTGTFDAIVNLGVTEHLPDYRRTLAQYQRLLKPGRRVFLDAHSGPKHGFSSFITKWIFEGNTSPWNLAEYLEEVAKTSFDVVLVKNDRHNYFLTCKKWAENLEAHREEIITRWGLAVYRRFRLYLWGAAHCFQTGALSAHRMVLELRRPDAGQDADRVFWT